MFSKKKWRNKNMSENDRMPDPEKIKEIVSTLNQGYDIVVATRRKIQDWSFSRNFMSKVATLLGKICLF